MQKHVGDRSTGWWTSFSQFLSQVSNLQTLWSLFFAVLSAIGVVVKLPSRPLTYLIAGASFLGVLAVSGTAIWVYNKAVPSIKRWRHPHSITVQLQVGNTIELHLTHHGEPAIWSATARIVELLDGSRNPDPTPYRCKFFKEGTSDIKMPLKDDEWTTITVANIRHSEWSHRTAPWLSVWQGYNTGVEVPNSGFIWEIKLNAIPPLKTGDVVKRYSITRDKRDGYIEATECE